MRQSPTRQDDGSFAGSIFTLDASAENKPPEPNRSQSSANRGAKKVCAWTDAPEPCAKKRAGRYHTIADQVISAICSSTQFRNGLAYDQRLAGRLAEFLHAPNDKSQRDRAK